MAVNHARRPLLAFLAMALSLLVPLPVGALIRCKTSILNRYKLSGLEYSVTSPMKVCPSVQDRCCSVTDEVTISKLWNDKTLPLLNEMTDKIIKNVWLSIQYYKNITLMDPGLIMVKHLMHRRIPYARRVCSTRERPLRRRDLARIQAYYQVADRGPDVDLGSFDFVNTFQSRHPNDTLWNLASTGHVNKTVNNPRLSPSFLGQRDEFNINSFGRTPRELEDVSAQYNYYDPNGFPAEDYQDDLTQFLTGEEERGPGSRDLTGTNETEGNPANKEDNAADAGVLPNMNVPSGVPDHTDMYRFDARPTPVVIPEQAPRPSPPPPPPLIPQISPPRPIPKREGRFPNEPPAREPSSYTDMYKETDKAMNQRVVRQPVFTAPTPGIPDPLTSEGSVLDLNDPDQREEAARRGVSYGTWADDEVFRYDALQDRLRSQNIRTPAVKRNYRMPRYWIEGRPLTHRATRCRSIRQSFIKDFIIINEEKVDFCFGLYRRFLNFDIEMFEGFLPKIKEIMGKLSEHKKSFYCVLCDAHKQNYFSIGNQMVYYANDYCRTTLSQFQDYFRFMNLIYVDFVDSILQYIQCFESDGLVFEFPFQNFLGRMKQRYPLWRRCLDALDSEFFINSCWSICNKLNINVRSSLIEGNLEFMERSTATIFSFLRKVRIESAKYNASQVSWNDTYASSFTLNLRTKANVDGLLAEPLGPATLITDNKYVIEEASSALVTKQVPGLNITERDAMQAAIDEMLEDLRLGSVQDLVNYGNKVVGYKRMSMPLNDMFVANSDRQVSRVNGLINQLYKLRSIQQLSPSEIPTRFLKQETFKIMNRFGLRPKEYVRTLKLFTPPGARKLTLSNNVIRPSRLHAKNHTLINSFGLPINHTRIPSPTPLHIQEPEVTHGDIESNVEVYAKIINGTDVRNLGVMYEPEGINPLHDFEMANYNFNITKLIGLQFTKTEKIDSDVIKQFVTCNAADINRFNENAHKHTMGLKDLESKFVGMKKASQMDTLAKILAPDKNVSLALQIQTRFRNKMSQMMKVHSKNQALETMEARMQEMYKLHAIMKEKERDKYRDVNHHWFSGFEELFNGIADMFVGLFGA